MEAHDYLKLKQKEENKLVSNEDEGLRRSSK